MEALAITPEMRWALVRGFAPADAVLSGHGGQPDPNLAFYFAVRFGLAPRIATRIPAKRLQSELGVEFARQLEISRVAAVSLERCAEDNVRAVAEIAAARAIPLVFTKEVALRLLGVSVAGARACGDIHVLLPSTRVRELHETLQARGFSWYQPPGSGPPSFKDVVSDVQAAVELHVSIPTHRLERKRAFASEAALLSSGLVVRAVALPGDAWVPKRPVLLAHVMAEGFALRGSPGCSPLLRMLSSVIDLDATQDPEIQSFLCHGRLSDVMSLFEVRAVCLLARALREGWTLEDFPRGSPAHLLLYHILAGILQPGYGQSQRFDFFGPDPPGRSRLLAPLDRLLRARVPKRAPLAQIYGGSRSQLGWVALRLHCPVDAFFCLQQSGSPCSVARNARSIGSALHVSAPSRSE